MPTIAADPKASELPKEKALRPRDEREVITRIQTGIEDSPENTAVEDWSFLDLLSEKRSA